MKITCHYGDMDVTWVGAALGVAVVLVWAWRAQRRKFADEMFAGVIPGLVPLGGQAETRVPVTWRQRIPQARLVAVAFNPPRSHRPRDGRGRHSREP